MTHEIELKGKKTTLMSHILTSNIGVGSVEETKHTDESGKWFLLVQKSLVTRVHNFVDTTLISLFNEHIPSELHHSTIITPGRVYVSTTSFLGLYADVLNKKIEPTNPQEDNQIKPSLAPECYWKHPAPALSMEDFPIITSKKQGTDTTTATSTLTPAPTHNELQALKNRITAKN
eukprot:13622656-Ditylum_brightwellii.AAC.2